MDNRKFEEKSDEEIRYENAKERVRKIRAFYAHLITYISVNVVIIGFNFLYHHFGYLKIKVNQFYSLIIWGIVVLIHALLIFLGSNWTKRKLKNLMNKDKF